MIFPMKYSVTFICYLIGICHGSEYFRLTHFSLSVGRTLDSLVSCGPVYTGQPAPGGNVTITCELKGRFVHFERTGGTDIFVVALCEVDVKGQRIYDCTLCPRNTPCTENGGCSQCAPGKYSPDCIMDCPSGWYGYNCTERCGKCRDGTQCLAANGSCTNGCHRFWVDNNCNTEIVKPDHTTEATKIVSIFENSITISWEQIRSVPSSATQYYGYGVFYKLQRAGDYTLYNTVKHKSTTTTNMAEVSGLEYHTMYDVRVEPYRVWTDNWKDWGRPYDALTLKTSCIDPDPIVKFNITGLSNTNTQREDIIVSWESPLSFNTGCDYFTEIWVEYKLSRDTDWTKNVVSITSTQHTLSPPAGGMYDVRVTVVNNENKTASSKSRSLTVEGPTTTTTTTTTTATTTTTKSTQTGSGLDTTTVIIIAASVGGIVVIVIIIIVVLLVKRRRGNSKDPEIHINPSFEKAAGSSKKNNYGDAIVAKTVKKPKPNLMSKGDNSYDNITKGKAAHRKDTSVPVSELEENTKKKHSDPEVFTTEYQKLPKEDQSRCIVAVTDENKPLNRFKNIYAYDETRVHLADVSNDQSNYINANYIAGYNGEREYIATQGPLPQTMSDLWRMVWQEKSNRIVMVANLVENKKRRCEQYWPDRVGKTVSYNEFSVTLEGEEISSDYTQRILTVTFQNETRTIRQFHFTTWEDKNKPVQGTITLFAFYKKIHCFDKTSKGPMVVHCSAGVGRTGTFIAFDILLNQAKHEGRVDIFGVIAKLREQRMFMVQTKGQYIFIHDALVEYLASGDTSYSCNDFKITYDSLIKPRRHLGGISELEKQFNVMTSFKPVVDLINASGAAEENEAKNRDTSILPDDSKRPHLKRQEEFRSDYINAVFVSSYKAHRHYIVTQMPLPNTIIDFWRLVKEQNCNTIIMLNSITTDDETCPPYWPEGDDPKQTYGPIDVELVNVNTEARQSFVVTRDFKVTNQSDMAEQDTDVQLVRQFQLLSWDADDVLPADHGDLLSLMDLVQNWQQQQGLHPGGNHHVLVHCLDGASRCGVYCGVSHTLDRMKIEQEVDAFLAARYVTRSRPQFINTLAQYSYLYEIAIGYMSRYNEYANFQ